MAQITPEMGLQKWDLVTDNFSHAQFAANLDILDVHDHTEDKGVQIPAGGIADLAISTGKVQDSAITAAKLGANAVTTTKLDTSAVTAAKINDGAVTRAKLSDSTLQAVRVTTGSLGPNGGASVTATFDTPFADINYTVTVGVIEATAGTSTVAVHHIMSRATTGVVVRVKNEDSGGSHTGTLNVIAIHD